MTIAYVDFLQLFGFRRSQCKLVRDAADGCVWREVTNDFTLKDFRNRALEAVSAFRRADEYLRPCGLRIPLPVESLYYRGSGCRLREPMPAFAGDGHDTDPHHMNSPLEDQWFRFIHFCFSRAGEHGFAHHISPKGSLSADESKALQVIGLEPRAECPYFDCDSCFWTASPTAEEGSSNYRELDEQYHSAHRRYHQNLPSRLVKAVEEILVCRSKMLSLGWDLFESLKAKPARAGDAMKTAEPEGSETTASVLLLQQKPPASPTPDQRRSSSASFHSWAGTKRLIVALVFTDIVDSTALRGRLGDEIMADVQRAHFTQSRKLIEQFGGYEIKTIGDSFLASFKSADAALDFAISLRREPGDSQLRVRAGIHVGPIDVEEEDAFGSAVNFAARVVSTIPDAKIRLSGRAKEDIDALAAKRHQGLRWSRSEGHILKGFTGRFTLWTVDVD